MSNYKEIALRLEKIREYLKVLLTLKKNCSLADLKRDKILRGALERYLQLAAEASIDIGEIIISELKLPAPVTNKEVFEVLGAQKIITPRLTENFSNLAKFRNVLVHDYVEVDLQKIYNYLQNDLSDFEKYIIAIAKFIKKYNK